MMQNTHNQQQQQYKLISPNNTSCRVSLAHHTRVFIDQKEREREREREIDFHTGEKEKEIER